MNLTLAPISLRDACAFVGKVHRHHKPPQGGKFAIAAEDDSCTRAVVIVGRPVARMLDDGYTLEVTRLASDGAANACSILYAAAWRASRAMGARRLITYTLQSESGGSLRASGWREVGSAGGGKWSRPSRARVNEHPTEGKTLWEVPS